MGMRVDQWDIHPQHFWLRGKKPETIVEYNETLQTWNVYGYPEVVDILTCPKVFSNNAGRLDPVEIDEELVAGDFANMDPPQHRKIRGLVDYAFTPNLVANLESRVDALIHELLDELADRGGFDLVADFSTPLPLTVICELLGIPSGDRHLFHNWMRKMMDDTEDFVSPEVVKEQTKELRRAFDLLKEMRDYWTELAAERRKRPREDLLSQLVQAEVDGERLLDTEVFNIANRLLIAGHHSTSILISNTMLCLDAFPEQAERVREDRSLLPMLIEESVRFLTPISGVARCTNANAEVAGQTIPKDQIVMVWAGAANRDERQFVDPHVFDATRKPNPHLGFSRGVHFCLGRRLARMEGRAAVNILLDRFPRLRTNPENPPTFYQIADAGGVDKLPVLVD